MDIAQLRREYTLGGLRRADLAPEPIAQFQTWLEQALSAQLLEPTAMTCATCDRTGFITSRIVLLKGLDARGFRFFTNLESRKAKQLREHLRASLTFFWPELERQVGVQGPVQPVAAGETDAYFQTRPRGSQLGAWVSHQSEVIANRSVLEQRWLELVERFGDQPISTPPHWGGFLVVPERVEFWQGRPNRLHDRFVYVRTEGGDWKIDRLSP